MTALEPAAPLAAIPAEGPFNTAAWLLDRHLDAGDGDRVAIRCGGVEHTYARLGALTRAAAAALRASGVRPEERVLVLMADTPEMVAVLLAAMRIGAIAVPVSTMLTGPELGFLAADCGARLAVVSQPFAAAVVAMAEAAPALTEVVVHGDPASLDAPSRLRRHDWDDWLGAGGADDGVAATTAESPAFWLYTSGTTGRPKAAMHRHADLPGTALTYASEVLGITADDRCLSVAKLFFAYGLGNSLTFPMSVGATAVLEPGPPTPASMAALAAAERPSLFFATPSFYAALLAADVDPDAFTSVRLGVSAGEPLPAGVVHRVRERLGLEVLDGIGSTEATHIFISNRPGQVRAGTSGTPVPGYAVRLVDEAGAEVAAGIPGNLLVRGDTIATGYWCRTAVTRRTFQGEWLRTGDTYLRDEAGCYVHCGRSDDMLKAGGIWVSPVEVEAVLVEHPDLLEAAVIGEPDADGIERPVAHVVPRPGVEIDPDEVISFCRSRLAAFKRPRRVIVRDHLPRTATGKVQRYILRQGG